MSNYMELLQQRVQALPFEIIPLGVDYPSLLAIDLIHNQYDSHDSQVICQRLLQEIPFARDTIVTRQGTSVVERRGTAWVAAPGVGALAYSGKLMAPQPLPTLVQSLMRAVEQRLGLNHPFFDCALCNHYADATAACKFHTDPEHGTMWDRTTVVVAAGSDRIFAFKPISTTWNDWDTAVTPRQSSSSPTTTATDGGSTATTTPLFAGDLVVMRENCNDDFYHAVHAGITDDPRVSVVLKRSMGPRGHGLPGQGRRSKNRNAAQSMVQPSPGKSPSQKRASTVSFKSKRKKAVN
jgi:alkylated DNA repair dioxygenase AlkB